MSKNAGTARRRKRGEEVRPRAGFEAGGELGRCVQHGQGEERRFDEGLVVTGEVDPVRRLRVDDRGDRRPGRTTQLVAQGPLAGTERGLGLEPRRQAAQEPGDGLEAGHLVAEPRTGLLHDRHVEPQAPLGRCGQDRPGETDRRRHPLRTCLHRHQ